MTCIAFFPFVVSMPLPVGKDEKIRVASSIPGWHKADAGRPGHRFNGGGKRFNHARWGETEENILTNYRIVS